MSDAYTTFLASKRVVAPKTGLAKLPSLPDALFAFQRDIASWALRRGRAALFAGTGLGKTLMELSWGQAIAGETGGMVLLFAPLAVSAQIIREAVKFGIPARLVRRQEDCGPGINVTNYQKADHFDLAKFVAVILDESSILKSTDGHFRSLLIERCQTVPFRLAATATPAPNDFMELGNHAEFLGVMSYTDMLATFFTHDGSETQKWRLKGHAETEFWKWMASWAVMIRKPSDLGYANDGYDLPPLNRAQHIVSARYAPSLDTGLLFPMEARTMQERLAARRDTVGERVALAATIVNGSYGGNLSTCRVEKNEPPTCGITGSATSESGSGRQNSRQPSTSAAESDTPPTRNIANRSKRVSGKTGRQKSAASSCSATTTASPQLNTTKSYAGRMDHVASAAAETAADGSTSIIATTQGDCEGSSALPATLASDSLATIRIASLEPSNTSERPEPWVVWCQLNSEQDALERAFTGRCISVRGSMSEDEKEAAILAWLRGEKPILVSKPSICGFGLNFQHCHNTVFVGLNDSFEQIYQATRRFWRFGQVRPVNVHFIAAETEGAVVANLRRKEADAERMAAAMVRHMADLSSAEVRGAARSVPDYNPQIPMTLPDFLEAA